MTVSFSSRPSGRAMELQIPKKWNDRDNTSPERTRVWAEPSSSKLKPVRRVPVVYYLSRNGILDQPHFMEVPLSSPEGLFLKDVINRLNLLRGKGMASLYSWSSKRSYKNSFVWHDLAENDFIYPSHGQEYVLKGSELLDSSINLKALEPPPLNSQASLESQKSGEDSDFPPVPRRRNQSWAAIDLQEYKVYKTESSSESARQSAADASTQTDERRRRRRAALKEEEEEEEPRETYRSQSTELTRDEISPPPSDSSPETLETLMKADGRLVLSAGGGNEDDPNRTAENFPSGRMKASTVLMQLLSCGSISFRDCGPSPLKDQGFSFVGHYKGRLPRGAGNHGGASVENPSFSGVKLEEKEYFSGSLIETKKEPLPALKRSSSYNADRTSQLQLAEKEIDGVRAKCIPRRHRGLPTGKECNATDKSCRSIGSSSSSSGDQHGSKRIENGVIIS